MAAHAVLSWLFGSWLWVFRSPVRVLGDLVRDDLGRFHFASEDGRVFALSGRGALVAHVPGRVPFSVLPLALPSGSIAAARRDGSVLLSRGGKNLRFELGSAASALLSCSGRELCAVVEGHLRGIGAGERDFSAKARYAASNGERMALVVDEKQVELLAAGGEKLAVVTLPDAPSAAPVLDERGRVFVPLHGGALLVLSELGVPVGCMAAGHSPLASPVLDPKRRRVLVTAREGIVAAFELP